MCNLRYLLIDPKENIVDKKSPQKKGKKSFVNKIFE